MYRSGRTVENGAGRLQTHMINAPGHDECIEVHGDAEFRDHIVKLLNDNPFVPKTAEYRSGWDEAIDAALVVLDQRSFTTGGYASGTADFVRALKRGKP